MAENRATTSSEPAAMLVVLLASLLAAAFVLFKDNPVIEVIAWLMAQVTLQVLDVIARVVLW